MMIINSDEILDQEIDFSKFWGSEQLKSRVVFSRHGTHYCIYCGQPSDTREHCPSRTFLSKPYPNNLAVLPACTKCNNSFSADEEYTEEYIRSLKLISEGKVLNNIDSMHKNLVNARQDAQNDFKRFKKTNKMTPNSRVLRILTKLSLGHMVYDLTEGYSIDGEEITPIGIKYFFSYESKDSYMEEYDDILFMSDKKLPIIGSRVYNRIYVIEPLLQSSNNGLDGLIEGLAFMDWADVQEDNYRYITWIDGDNTFHVKIVIHDFLFAEVIYSI